MFKNVEPDQNGNPRVEFPCTLKSLGENILKNVNGTEYAVGTIEFISASGEIVERTAMFYKKNIDKGNYKVGNKYAATATKLVDENGKTTFPTTVAPFAPGERTSEEDFGNVFAEVKASKEEVAAQPKLKPVF